MASIRSIEPVLAGSNHNLNPGNAVIQQVIQLAQHHMAGLNSMRLQQLVRLPLVHSRSRMQLR
ncbi:MAG: hypothetical protein CMJ39_04655 [Phycisphaerae bacterium]|nr:hypothetical protein [Phycisphaerae bacterium]